MAILLLISGYAYGEVTEEICFSAENGAAMVKEIEDCRVQSEIVRTLKEENVELQKKIENLEKISAMQDAQLATANETIEKMKEIQENQKQAYEKQIKEMKPSFWSYLKTSVGGAIIGGLAVAIIAIL